MLIHRILFATCLAISTSGLQAQHVDAGPSPPSVQLPPELTQLLRDYEIAWTARDANALAALFTPDGLALPNGSPPARGSAAIASEYAKNAGGPLYLRAIAFSRSQDFAYIVGGFTGAAGNPDIGKFVLVLQRGSDGRWRIAADIDNMNSRPRPPIPAGATAPTP